MTRDFKKQGRDDSRPSFRNQSSGDRRNAHPPRPRLNREIVDRAWEAGAQHNHADYSPRRANGQSQHNDRRNYPRQNDNPSSNGRRSGRPHDYRETPRDTSRSFERTPRGNYPASSSRSFDSDRRGFENRQRSGERRSPADERDRGGDPGNRSHYNPQTRDRGARYGERDSYRGNQGRQFDRRPSREFDRPTRDAKPEERRFHQERSFKDTRPQGHSPAHQRHQEFRRSSHNEQFEGDYEHFDHKVGRSDRSAQGATQKKREDELKPSEARQVTRLPDGRVIKGPRPAQRKQAEFWTDIAEDTDTLVSRVHAEPTPEEVVEHQQDTQTSEPTSVAKSATPPKPRRRVASAATRQKKASTAKPRSSGPKPSQRGFKWPTP